MTKNHFFTFPLCLLFTFSFSLTAMSDEEMEKRQRSTCKLFNAIETANVENCNDAIKNGAYLDAWASAVGTPLLFLTSKITYPQYTTLTPRFNNTTAQQVLQVYVPEVLNYYSYENMKEEEKHYKNQIQILKTLLEHDVDANVQFTKEHDDPSYIPTYEEKLNQDNYLGYTPLMFAVKSSTNTHSEAVDALLPYSDPRIKSNKGHTALEIARRKMIPLVACEARLEKENNKDNAEQTTKNAPLPPLTLVQKLERHRNTFFKNKELVLRNGIPPRKKIQKKR